MKVAKCVGCGKSTFGVGCWIADSKVPLFKGYYVPMSYYSVISTGKICFNKFGSGEILPFCITIIPKSKISPLRSFLASVGMTQHRLVGTR